MTLASPVVSEGMLRLSPEADLAAAKAAEAKCPGSCESTDELDSRANAPRLSGACAMCPRLRESASVAVSYCLQCGDGLCASCSYCHTRTKLTANHELVAAAITRSRHPGNDDEGADRPTPWRPQRKPCGVHVDKILEAYCLPCAKVREHDLPPMQAAHARRAHLCTDLEPAAEEQRRRLRVNIARLRHGVLVEADETIRECRQRLEEADGHRLETLGRVADTRLRMQQQLVAYSAALGAQLDALHAQYKEQIDQIVEDVSDRRGELEALRLESERLLEGATDGELLTVKATYDAQYERTLERWRRPEVPRACLAQFHESQAGSQAVSILFGSFGRGAEEESGDLAFHSLLHRVPGAAGRLPHLSKSGRIYDYHIALARGQRQDGGAAATGDDADGAGNESGGDLAIGISSPGPPQQQQQPAGEANQPSARSRDRWSTVAKARSLKVIGMPALVCRRSLRDGSVTHLTVAASGHLIAAVFLRSRSSLGVPAIERVRVLTLSPGGCIVGEFRAGSVIYGLAAGPNGLIVTSGGDIGPDSRRINVYTAGGQLSKSMNCSADVGGVAISRAFHVVAAVGSHIVAYSLESAQLIWAFSDAPNGRSDYKELRKQLAVGRNDEIYVSDPNTRSVRGFTQRGELLFEYGNYKGGAEMAFRPRALCVDAYGHVIVADAAIGRLHVLSAKGAFRCTFLDESSGGPLRRPRAVAALNKTQVAIGLQAAGELLMYQYLFDEQQ